jgi:hypothetical protein
MKTTIDTITVQQVRVLRRNAIEAGNDDLAAMCKVALERLYAGNNHAPSVYECLAALNETETEMTPEEDAAETAALAAKLDIRNREHFDACVEFAKKAGKWEGDQGLKSGLERIVHLAGKEKAVLFKDFAPYSFEFAAGGFQGGLIFHGRHDGGGSGSAPTFSVCLEPCDGWSIHT